MRILYTLLLVLLTNYWIVGQYPFSHIPANVLDEIGKMPIPKPTDWEVSSS
jgi:hypothetical protein